MSNEAIVFLGTPKTLESSGGSIASLAVVQATVADYSIIADGANYPDAEFVLTATFSVAPVENTKLALYARSLDVDGATDTEVPEAGRPEKYIGDFSVNNVTSAQTMVLRAQDVPTAASYYIHNVNAGQSVAAGWVLKVTPRTIGPAA